MCVQGTRTDFAPDRLGCTFLLFPCSQAIEAAKPGWMLSPRQMTTPVTARNKLLLEMPFPLLMLTGYLGLVYDGENGNCLFQVIRKQHYGKKLPSCYPVSVL